MIPVTLFCILKCKCSTKFFIISAYSDLNSVCVVAIVVIFYLIYKPLKYKDDGRDVVGWLDFVTIHTTFPAINAWVSY